MGKISIPVRRVFLNKKACRREAKRIISEGLIDGMDEMQLAREIYFHALAFYFCEKTGLFPVIKKHADPIDLRDDGDNIVSQRIFDLFWHVPEKWVKRR